MRLPTKPHGQFVIMWHPDSPGGRVRVWLPWWRRKSRQHATLAECIRSHRPIRDNTGH